MKGEKVWGKAKERLRSEVPRSDYETWIRDTEGIKLTIETLTVGVVNDYGRDWLEEHMKSNAQRAVSEILGRNVEIRFKAILDNQDEGSCIGIGETVQLEAHYLSLYDEIVRPERVIVIPRYYLRWIPWLGVGLAWLPVGFRQAAFLNGYRVEAGEEFKASATDIARWSGISRAKFWRRINDPYLRWFIQPADEGKKGWKLGKDNIPHQIPRSWKLVMSMPLTPSDQDSLRVWLRDRINEGIDPVSILNIALETPLDKLIPWPEEIITPEIGGEPMSVQQIVTEVFDHLDPLTTPVIDELSNNLQGHILNGVILIRHYFVEKWLPLLKSGPGWLATILRSACYHNPKTDELRNDVWVAEGYAELAQVLGIRRPQTIAEWLQGRKSSDVETKENKKAELLSEFIKEIERHKGPTQAVALRFKVAMSEPLIPKDKLAYKQCIDGMGTNANETHVEGGTNANETHVMGGTNENETHVAGGINANETVLKDSLNKVPLKLKYLKDINTTTSAKTKVTNNGNEAVVVELRWDLSKLLTNNRVDAKIKGELVKSDTSAEVFVSWLLYAASPKGSGIGDPIGHAVSRVRKDPAAGAGKDYERLAELPPQDLADLIYRELQGTAKWAGSKDWIRVMRDADRDRVETLAGQLGVVVVEGDDS